MKCEHCHEEIANPKKGQRFCVGKGCRQKHHREQTLPGKVSGIRALKNGGWSVTIHQSNRPELKIGSRVSLKTTI